MSILSTADRLAAVVVIYPAAMLYFEDFIKSYSNQRALVPLLIYSDGVSKDQVETVLGHYKIDWQLTALPLQQTIAQNRIYLIEALVKLSFEWFLFIDADDLMSQNRIELTLKFLNSSADILYNSITHMSGLPYFQRSLPSRLDKLQQIAAENFVGLSAVSLKKSALQSAMHMLQQGAGCIAFDWFLISALLASGAQGILLPDCVTFYRIHNENTAGALWLDTEKYLAERAIKHLHYKAISSFYPEAEAILQQMIEVEQGLAGNYKDFIDFINRTQKRFWWSCIDDYETYCLYQQACSKRVE